ncbi:kinetochore Sim4 complex subunit FTA2-domain-containing protein [Xylariaceae sp. FL1019]|nr:kinetochore Sim4 complex subunit FTA2-domain-containing protein [Xylariaceae sp. FL1019]
MAGLPDVPGPKVFPFDTKGQPLDIEFIEELGSGMHSYVWKVSINGTQYALKIFNWLRERVPWQYENFVDLSPEEKTNYFDPFQNECRAYGRLKEFCYEHLAIPCHGYIIFTSDSKEWQFLYDTYEQFMRGNWQYDANDDVRNEPLCALVKDILPDTPDCFTDAEFYDRCVINPRTARKAVKDLRMIHRLGIAINDIHESNYTMGLYIDFSRAWTAPHPFLTRRFGPDFPPLQDPLKDPYDMDDIIETWNEYHPTKEKIWDRCRSSMYYVKRLRSCRRNRGWDVHPADFDYSVMKRSLGAKKSKNISVPVLPPYQWKLVPGGRTWSKGLTEEERFRAIIERWSLYTHISRR